MISSHITSSSIKLAEARTMAKPEEAPKVESKIEPGEASGVSSPSEISAVESPEAVVEPARSQDKKPWSEEAEKAIREKLSEAVSNVRDFIKKNQRSLDFEMAEESNRVIITVIDRETNEVIRQIPPEEMLSIAEQLKQGDMAVHDGLLFNTKV